MQVSVETLSNIERRITVGVPAERIDSEVDKRVHKAARTARIDGFRAGKVPVKLIRQKYGRGIRQEVLGELIQSSFYEAVTQEKLNPISTPSVETKTSAPGKNLEYTATFEVYPEIELSGLSDIKVERIVAEVTDQDIDKMIEQLRSQRTRYNEVDRAAQDQDQVVIDFTGTIDGETFKGGSAENYKLVVGSKSMIEGFEDGLLGLKAGEEKDISLKFPEKYHASDLAGKDVSFAVKVKSVNEPALPEVDDDFILGFGIKEGGVDAFRTEVKKNMEKELDKAIEGKLKNALVDALLETNQVELPKSMVRKEIDRLRQEMAQQFGGGQKIDPSALPAELFTQQAEKRVATGLLMNRFMQEKGIIIDESRLDSYLTDFAESYDQPEEVISYIRADEQQLEHFRSIVLEQQIIDALVEQVQVTEVKQGYDDAIKAAQPEAREESGAEKKKAERKNNT